MRSYNYIVVLSGKITKEEGRFVMPEFYDELAQGGTMRLDAAAKLYFDNSAQKLVMTGGKVRNSSGNDENADVMAKYLISKGIPAKKIIIIHSKSNTMGNARAVKRYFATHHIKGKIGLLTSFWHLPRAMKIFMREGLNFEPIAAEAVLFNEEQKKILNICKHLNMTNRIHSEIKGLSDLEKGTYKPRIN